MSIWYCIKINKIEKSANLIVLIYLNTTIYGHHISDRNPSSTIILPLSMSRDLEPDRFLHLFYINGNIL